MNRFFTRILLCLCLSTAFSHDISIQAQQLSFPGAVGFGRYSTGGRYGSVYHVTNLNDSGTGSLRDAVSKPNRIVVFDVAGVIHINSRIVFASNLYVAGQTAPGEGVVVYGDGVSFSGSNNIIVRYMKFRMGKSGSSGKDAAGVANGTDMIFDHCSFAWGLDETFSINWDNKGTAPGNITISNCIIGQGLLTHSAGGLIQADDITLYRNFYCDNSTRNNKVKGRSQYVNCIVYNWSNGCYLMGGDSNGKSYVNVTNNLFINGPSGGGNAITSGNSDFHIHAADNWQDRNRDGILNPYEIPQSEYSGGPTFENTPYDYPELPTWQAQQLIDSLLPEVGASLPYRDLADHYMVHQARSLGTEGALISSESQLPMGAPTGWDVQATFGKRNDSDGDGMPDEWEKAHGLNLYANDAMAIAANGYANIENYINSLTINNRAAFLRPPFQPKSTASTDNSITLQWFDFTEGEENFIIEVYADGAWKEAALLATDTESHTLTDLQAATTYKVRMRARGADNSYSAYTPELTVKTQPKQVAMIDIATYSPDYTWNADDGSWNTIDDNWLEGIYANGKNVLFSNTGNAKVTLSERLTPSTIVVNNSGDVAFEGVGSISGNTSLNKAGEGTLTINNTNSYTGATVLHDGTLAFSTLKNGEEPSAIGGSSEFSQNWIWDGGCWNYTGTTTATNRSAKIYKDTEFSVEKAGTTVTMTGQVEGSGNVTFSGKGRISPSSPAFFAYEGNTIVKEGTLFLGYLGSQTNKDVYVGFSGGDPNKLVLAGGSLLTKDANDNYSTYRMPIELAEGTTSTMQLHQNCYIKSKFTGTGTLDWRIAWVREYLQGDMTDFYGRLIATAAGSSNQLMLDTDKGIPNGVVQLKGNIRMVYWQTNGDLHIGGLSGDRASFLSGSSKQTAGHKMTWRIGGANTNETFAGTIDDCASNTADKYKGTTAIVKEGSGTWRLTGNNIYSGTTQVEGGRLFINGSNNGAGTFTVKDGATLGGQGTIASRVVVQAGGTLWAGDSIVSNTNVLKLNGGLTLNKDAILEIPLSYIIRPNNNRISVSGSIAISGATLVLNLDKAPAIRDNAEFQIFDNLGTVTGAGFTTILPERPSDTQLWDTSTLLKDGKLRVVKDETVGISRVAATDKEASTVSYDLNGRPVGDDYHGIIIRNGKKVIR